MSKKIPWDYAKNGAFTEISAFLRKETKSKHFDVNSRNPETGETLLFTAVSSVPLPVNEMGGMHYINIIRLLCETYNADIGVRCSNTGYTPIHEAARRNSVELTRYLAVKQGGPFIKDNNGNDPYKVAVLSGSTGAAKVLEAEIARRAEGAQPGSQKAGSPAIAEVSSPRGRPRMGLGELVSPKKNHMEEAYRSQPRSPTKRVEKMLSQNSGRDRQQSPDKDLSRRPTLSGRGGSGFLTSFGSTELGPPPLGAPGFCTTYPNTLKVLPKLRENNRNTSPLACKFMQCAGQEIPQLIQRELADFKATYNSIFDFICTRRVENHSENRAHSDVYVLHIRGLLPYTVRGAVYNGPVILLGYYPADSCRTADAGGPKLENLSRRESGTSISLPMSRTNFYPRFRAFVDLTNLNHFMISARASTYLDLLSGAFLPSPCDNLFPRLVLFTQHVVVKCFESSPPMVVAHSAAAFPLVVPLSSNFDRPDASKKSTFQQCLLPSLRLMCTPLAGASAGHRPKGRAGSIMDCFVYSPPPSVQLISPIDGQPCSEKAKNDGNTQDSMPLLFPFTAARHPFCNTMSPDSAPEANSLEEEKQNKRNRHAAIAKSWRHLRFYRIYQDISSFADGLFAFLPQKDSVVGVLPILGSRPKTILVHDVTNISELAAYALTTKLSSEGNLTSNSSFPTSNPPSKVGKAYRLDVNSVERLLNVRVRIEFKDNIPESSPKSASPYDYPPRIFFVDAVASSGQAKKSLTQSCFEHVLKNAETGELDPKFVTFIPSDGSADDDAKNRSLASPTFNASLPPLIHAPRSALLLLDPDVWRAQARPVLELLVALKDLATQLLGYLAKNKGDEKLMQEQQTTLNSGTTVESPSNCLDNLFKESPLSSPDAPASPKLPAGGSNREKCILCLQRNKEIVFRPCRHLVSCRKCIADHCLHEMSSNSFFASLTTSGAPTLEANDGAVTEFMSRWKCPTCGAFVRGISEVYI